MLIALVAKLAGFDGGFDFKDIGKWVSKREKENDSDLDWHGYIRDYLGPGVPYVPMRVFCALNGVLTVPIAYWTMRQSGHSVASAVVAALMVCYGKYQEVSYK